MYVVEYFAALGMSTDKSRPLTYVNGCRREMKTRRLISMPLGQHSAEFLPLFHISTTAAFQNVFRRI